MVSPSSTVRTKLLIISDTHGLQPFRDGDSPPFSPTLLTQCAGDRILVPFRHPLPEADVAIHCGDLTRSARTDEFTATFAMLRAITAPLKLVIAGNHDLALDEPYWTDRADEYRRRVPDKPEWYQRQLQRPREVKDIIDAAREDGVHYLVEGTYEFRLQNGARLRVFASPHTPIYGGWAFQYLPGEHVFDIPPGIDVVMTHGPPQGILDYAFDGNHAGCAGLFNSIYRARPKIHCFGHIHEAWGAYHVRWNDIGDDQHASVRTAVDHSTSTVVAKTSQLRVTIVDDEETRRRKEARTQIFLEDGCCSVGLGTGEDSPFEAGKETLFVNAAILDRRYMPVQFPWLVEIDLPIAGTGTE